MGKETATLAGGCFWCLEAVYDDLTGVDQVVSGYSGGEVKDPSYQQVTSGRTGHAESVRITYDPDIISYRELLEVFFTIHDPTTLNRQGADIGPQYRSAIFYETPEQAQVAEEVVGHLTEEGVWDDPIVTELVPLKRFWAAEEYHQKYFAKNPEQPYCQVVIAPKVAKFRQKYFAQLKSKGAA